jgi:hypothetical protein
MVEDSRVYVAFDVAKAKHAVAVAEPGSHWSHWGGRPNCAKMYGKRAEIRPKFYRERRL